MHARHPTPTRSDECPAGGVGMLRAFSAPDCKRISRRPAPSGVRGRRFGPLGAVPLGAVPLGTGLVEFRVWAPDAVDEKRRILRVRRGGVELAVDFERLTAEVVP